MSAEKAFEQVIQSLLRGHESDKDRDLIHHRELLPLVFQNIESYISYKVKFLNRELSIQIYEVTDVLQLYP